MASIISIKTDELSRLSGDLAKLSGDLSSLDQQIRNLENELREDVSAIGKYGGSTLLTGSIGGQRAFAYQAEQLMQLSQTAQRAAEMAEQTEQSVKRGIEGLPSMAISSMAGNTAAIGSAAVAGAVFGNSVISQLFNAKKLKEIFEKMRKIAEENGWITPGGGSGGSGGSGTGGGSGSGSGGSGSGGSSGTGGPSSTPVTGSHEVKMVSAWSGNRKKEDWPEGYDVKIQVTNDKGQKVWVNKYGSGCGVAASSSAISALLGKEVKPKAIMAANVGYKGDTNTVSMKNLGSNPEFMEWGKVATANGLKMTDLHPGGKDATLKALDDALTKHQQNPDKYAAPIIGSTHKGTNHYVVVTAKNDDGTYQIVDSSGKNAGVFRYSANTAEQQLESKKKGGYVAKANQIIQYYK